MSFFNCSSHNCTRIEYAGKRMCFGKKVTLIANLFNQTYIFAKQAKYNRAKKALIYLKTLSKVH